MANMNAPASKGGSGRLAVYIIIAMILGIIFGWLVNSGNLDLKSLKAQGYELEGLIAAVKACAEQGTALPPGVLRAGI